MPKQNLAIALCRVSSLEQLKNNSLNTQKDNVLKAAELLNVTIPSDGLWEGQVSSKKGVNFNRKDLIQMYEYCKKHTSVRYLIVQEVDRFMRSPEEQTYWYVKFKYELNVLIWFADKPELNEDSHNASLFRFLEGWRAGGSNEERMGKSIRGHVAALQQGKWTFNPKPGYVKGKQSGVPEVHPVKGLALKKILQDILDKKVTPTQGLKDFNVSPFMNDGHSKYKMDKFRKIATDPFYAGVVYMDKQVKVRNENGLHEPLITLEQHYALVRIFDDKKKNQKGPRKNGNPEYPASNMVTCELCIDNSQIPRYVGFKHGNGKNPNLVYHKYRCRACGRYISREEMHSSIEQHIKNNPITDEGVADFTEALEVVWKRKEAQAKQDIERTTNKIKHLKKTISSQAIAAIDRDNLLIKQEILDSVAENKQQVEFLEDELERLVHKADSDKDRFLRFAYNFAQNMGNNFFEISKENRLRCKQLIFPSGFYLDANNKVYTPEISPLITLQAKKKDTEVSEDSLLVRVRRL